MLVVKANVLFQAFKAKSMGVIKSTAHPMVSTSLTSVVITALEEIQEKYDEKGVPMTASRSSRGSLFSFAGLFYFVLNRAGICFSVCLFCLLLHLFTCFFTYQIRFVGLGFLFTLDFIFSILYPFSFFQFILT